MEALVNSFCERGRHFVSWQIVAYCFDDNLFGKLVSLFEFGAHFLVLEKKKGKLSTSLQLEEKVFGMLFGVMLQWIKTW